MKILRLFAFRSGNRTDESRLRFTYGKGPRRNSRSCFVRSGMLRDDGDSPSSGTGQRCCGLKAPMVLIRSSKSSRETSVCPLIFDR